MKNKIVKYGTIGYRNRLMHRTEESDSVIGGKHEKKEYYRTYVSKWYHHYQY